MSTGGLVLLRWDRNVSIGEAVEEAEGWDMQPSHCSDLPRAGGPRILGQRARMCKLRTSHAVMEGALQEV